MDDLSGSEDHGDTFDNKEKRKICFESNLNSNRASENSGSSYVSTPGKVWRFRIWDELQVDNNKIQHPFLIIAFFKSTETENKQSQEEKQDDKALGESKITKVFAPRIKPRVWH